MIGLLKMFHHNIYVLLDSGVKFSFVTPYVVLKFFSNHFQSLYQLVILLFLNKFMKNILFRFLIEASMLIW